MRIKELSELTGVKSGTIRFYEKCGYVEQAERLPNQYRVFHWHHYYQVRICSLVFCGFVNKRLRKISMSVIAAASQWNLEAYEGAVADYADAVDQDICGTKKAIEAVKLYLDGVELEATEIRYTKKQAAELIGVTPESIRNWERNGLLPQGEAYQKRYYGEKELSCMYAIRLLLDVGYSLMAIRCFLQKCEQGKRTEALALLSHPGNEADLIYRADRYLETLQRLRETVDVLKRFLPEMKKI